MMENKINQNGAKPAYEPVKVQVQQINPTGVLCSSGESGSSIASMNLNADAGDAFM